MAVYKFKEELNFHEANRQTELTIFIDFKLEK